MLYFKPDQILHKDKFHTAAQAWQKLVKAPQKLI